MMCLCSVWYSRVYIYVIKVVDKIGDKCSHVVIFTNTFLQYFLAIPKLSLKNYCKNLRRDLGVVLN